VSPAVVPPGPSAGDLTDEQRRIVAWEDGPLVVIAGAGTGKTRVIVERVRRLLETKGAPSDGAEAAGGTGSALRLPAEAASADPDDSFAGPLMPEQILVLTYNVKAAKELADRLEKALGPAVRARLAVANFHSFCHRILVESAPDAGLPSMPDILDGVGQVLLLRDLRPGLPLLYYSGRGNPYLGLDRFVAFINRAKDELVSPDDFDAYVAAEQAAFESRYGPYERALERLEALGSFDRGRNDSRPGKETIEALRKTLHRLIEDECVSPWRIAVLSGVTATASGVWRHRRFGNAILCNEALRDDGSSKGLPPENVPDEPDEVLFETIRRFKGMERDVIILVELPTEGDRLDELLYVGLTRATTELVVIAPPELARRLS
jgi:superfamily I DNA/RNA helicase